MTDLHVRRALPDEAEALTALAIRSKRHWGYDEAFMVEALPVMAIGAQVLAHNDAYVAERDGEILGVYVLGPEEGAPTLRELWVEPAAIGTGVGRVLWTHMLERARDRGYASVRIVSDPHAEGFYAKMGARRVGWYESKVGRGRMLPVLELTVGG